MNYIVGSGGLGNQMFQYAFYYLAKKKKDNIRFDISYFSVNSAHNGFELERCFGITDYVEKRSNVTGINLIMYRAACLFNRGKLLNIKREKMNIYIYDIPWNHSIIYGYWQSAIFFANYEKLIRDLFRFKGITKQNMQLAELMETQNSVAIHVRRGDYLKAVHYYDLCETKYYQKSINYINQTIKNPRYYIFSDDISWCKNSMIFPKDALYIDWNKGEESYQDMYLISKAKCCITGNSTFSWWAAFLGDQEIILRPSKYKDDWDDSKIDLFYPSGWTIIEV